MTNLARFEEEDLWSGRVFCSRIIELARWLGLGLLFFFVPFSPPKVSNIERPLRHVRFVPICLQKAKVRLRRDRAVIGLSFLRARRLLDPPGPDALLANSKTYAAAQRAWKRGGGVLSG